MGYFKKLISAKIEELNVKKYMSVMSVLLLMTMPAFAAEKWNDTLTMMGAQKSGNTDGSIPAWTGGIVTLPENYKQGGFHPDPFSNDKPIFTITSENWKTYQDKLSAGHQALLQKYPDYKMPVYPTRRSASYPQFVYDAIRQNADVSELSDEGNGVKGGSVAVPFPIPQNGLQAIWNHLLRYRGASINRIVNHTAVLSAEDMVSTIEEEKILFPLSVSGTTFDAPENILAYFKQNLMAPTREAGTLVLVYETLNKEKELRKSWLYNPGQRRVSRAPFISYDSIPPTNEGLSTFDQYDMYNGATDRYTWTLEGKQEMYIPYNAYRFADKKVDVRQALGAHFPKPELTRYELHRVWKINAVLKSGKKHLYARRVFYLDEDSWQIVAVDLYDARGELWRFSEGHLINFYEVPLMLPSVETHYDLKSGQYLAGALQVEPVRFNVNLTRADFTPDTLRREGNR